MSVVSWRRMASDLTDQVRELQKERDELLAEVERLTRWKAEALPVMTGLQELGKALGLTLGESITGPSAADAAHALRARAEAAEQAVERVRELAEYWSVSGNSWRKAAARQFLHALDGGE